MIFSELKSICDATGLSYDDETGILSGTKHGVDIAVFDNKAQHRFDIICGAMLLNDHIPKITALADSFPKKTLIGAENAGGCVKVYCKAYNLMQENLPLLIDFLEKLTDYANGNKISATNIITDDVLSLEKYAVIRKGTPKKDAPKEKSKTSPDEIKRTVKGAIGGLIGTLLGISIFVVFLMFSDILGWIGGVIMAAAIVSLYTFFSRKLKAADVIISGVLIAFGWFFSNSFTLLFKIFLRQQEAGESLNLFVITDNLQHYVAKHIDLANLYTNNLLVTFVFVLAGALGSYYFYYKSNRGDMY
ncbi:MAG: hypothetical protein IKT78_02400 [Ruminiclostridium sp.]|nr:hypothetical protein [Ruminiclostridium sp.]